MSRNHPLAIFSRRVWWLLLLFVRLLSLLSVSPVIRIVSSRTPSVRIVASCPSTSSIATVIIMLAVLLVRVPIVIVGWGRGSSVPTPYVLAYVPVSGTASPIRTFAGLSLRGRNVFSGLIHVTTATPSTGRAGRRSSSLDRTKGFLLVPIFELNVIP